MEITREYAEKIAKDFIDSRNPINWDGHGRRPKGFSTKIKTYDFGSPWVVLDISFEYEKKEEGDMGWHHFCEIVDKETVETCEVLSGYGIDSYLNLADTIMDICNTYDWFVSEEEILEINRKISKM